jgi:hypothetical protein
LEEKQSNKVLDNNSFYLLKFTITELAADKILILEQKKSTISKWFQQHDQFRIQMGCPEDYEFISLNIQTS